MVNKKTHEYIDPRIKQLRNNREKKKIGEFLVKKHIGWRTSPSGENHPLYEVECSCGNVKIFTGKYLGLLERKEIKLKVGEGSKEWKLNCNDHPHHFTSARVGNRLSYLEVVDLPRNTGQVNWKNSKRPSDGPGKFLIACICHAPSPKCKHKNRKNPKFITYRYWEQRLEKVANGKYTSCGCLGSAYTHGLLTNEDPIDKSRISLFYNASAIAKREQIPINIDPEYMKSLDFPKTCPVLGIPIHYGSDIRSDNSPSIDKFYPELGYVKGNVQIISWRANRFKSDGSPEEWEEIAEWCKKEDIRLKLEGNHPDQKKKSD